MTTPTARKKHTCDACGSDINPGEKYRYGKGRGPNLNIEDDQEGVRFWEYRVCFDEKACIERFIEFEGRS